MVRVVYEIRVPLIGQPDGYFTIARCLTPEAVGDIVRVLCANTETPIGGPAVRVMVTVCSVEDR